MPSKKKPLIFIKLSDSTFQDRDEKLLREKWDILSFTFFPKGAKNWKVPFRLLAQILWILLHGFKQAPVLIWFVDYHGLIPVVFSRIFHNKVFLVLGGFDTVNMPERNYGVFSGYWRGKIARVIYNSAHTLLPVSSTLIKSKNRYTFYPEEKSFGLLEQIELSSEVRIQEIPTSYDPDFWSCNKEKRPVSVCTVAYINNDQRVWIKGVDLFLAVAKLLPNTDFSIVGIPSSYSEQLKTQYDVPSNVTLYPPFSEKELVEFYNSHSAYMQLSRLEGLPNVLCEAMLCGCLPFGSKIFGIPDVIENERFLFEIPDVEYIAKTLEKELNEITLEKRLSVRQQIISKFSIEKREEMLNSILSNG